MSLYDKESCLVCGAPRHKHRKLACPFVEQTAADAADLAWWALIEEVVAEVRLRRREIPNWENEGGSCGDQGGTDDEPRSTRHLTTRPRG